jgi:hypothetical protein
MTMARTGIYCKTRPTPECLRSREQKAAGPFDDREIH